MELLILLSLPNVQAGQATLRVESKTLAHRVARAWCAARRRSPPSSSSTPSDLVVHLDPEPSMPIACRRRRLNDPERPCKPLRIGAQLAQRLPVQPLGLAFGQV